MIALPRSKAVAMAMPDLEGIARAICMAENLTFHGHVGAGSFKETFKVSGDEGVRALAKTK